MKNEYKKGLIFDEYRKIPACHKSALGHVGTAKHLALFEAAPSNSDALRFGKIFHAHLLEPETIQNIETYDEMEWIAKDKHPEKIAINDQKRAWKEARQKADTPYYLNADEKTDCSNMAQAILNNPLARSFLNGPGDRESSLFWVDPKTGLYCKTRLDWMREDDVLVEIKTDADPSPEAFGKKVYNYGYHMGAQFNRMGFREVFGRDIKGFVYIVVGKSAPYPVSVFRMTEYDFGLGEVDVYPLMKRYQIIKSGAGYQDYNAGPDGRYELLDVQTPRWEMSRLEYSQRGDDAPDEGTL